MEAPHAPLVDPSLFFAGTTGVIRLVVLGAAVLAALNLPMSAHRSRAMLAVAALGVIWLSEAATVAELLLATAMVTIGGSLAAWCLADDPDRPAVRRWHQTATLGFVLLSAGTVLLAGMAGSLQLGEMLPRLVLRGGLPPLALPLVFGLGGVGLALSVLGEPGRFGSAIAPALTGWLTTAPLLGLAVLLLRVLEPVSAPLLTWAAGLLIVGGFLAAAAQRSLAHRLAWAATGQAGLVLMVVVSAPVAGRDAALQHLLVFVPAQLGALLLCHQSGAGGPRRPVAAFVLAALLLALAALPPLAGWRARVALLQTLLAGDHVPAAALVLLGALLGVIVYALPIVDLWRRDPQQAPAPAVPWRSLLTAVLLLGVLVIRGVGLLPLLPSS